MVEEIIEKDTMEVPSYIDGEVFTFSVPPNIREMDCKLPTKVYWNSDIWNPWPTKIGVIRRVGNWLLKLHERHGITTGYGKTLTTHPFKMIRSIDENPNMWYVYDVHWDGWHKEKDTSLRSFNGRHVLSLLKEDFPELYVLPHSSNPKDPKVKKEKELRTPTPIDPNIIKKVFGRSTPRIETGWTNHEFADRRNKFILDAEWYRKELLKIQRKLESEAKKAQAEELGITVTDILEQKRKESEVAKAAQLTQEWIEISTEVFKTIDFLNDVVKEMGQRKSLDREWFDKGRRRMRDLATVMRPLNSHFPKSKE